MTDCPKCMGNGEIEIIVGDATHDFEAKIILCPLCNGVGCVEREK